MHIISAADFPLFCSNSARKCLILAGRMPASKSLILLEIRPEEFIQTYLYTTFPRIIAFPRLIAPSNNNSPP